MKQNNLEQHAQQLGQDSKESGQAWQEALELVRTYFKPSELSDEHLFKIAKASLSTARFNLFIKEAYRSCQGHPDRARPFKTLFSYCDESIYSLKEWILTFDHFQQYLSRDQRREDMMTMLGYLQCCSLSPENKDIKHEFIDLLDNMLLEYGFDGKNTK